MSPLLAPPHIHRLNRFHMWNRTWHRQGPTYGTSFNMRPSPLHILIIILSILYFRHFVSPVQTLRQWQRSLLILGLSILKKKIFKKISQHRLLLLSNNHVFGVEKHPIHLQSGSGNIFRLLRLLLPAAGVWVVMSLTRHVYSKRIRLPGQGRYCTCTFGPLSLWQ